jgi:hypothetical protein
VKVKVKVKVNKMSTTETTTEAQEISIVNGGTQGKDGGRTRSRCGKACCGEGSCPCYSHKGERDSLPPYTQEGREAY